MSQSKAKRGQLPPLQMENPDVFKDLPRVVTEELEFALRDFVYEIRTQLGQAKRGTIVPVPL